jgi:hypothetical protein
VHSQDLDSPTFPLHALCFAILNGRSVLPINPSLHLDGEIVEREVPSHGLLLKQLKDVKQIRQGSMAGIQK